MGSGSEDKEKYYREKVKTYTEAGFLEDQAEYIVDLQIQIDELKQRVSDLENSQ